MSKKKKNIKENTQETGNLKEELAEEDLTKENTEEDIREETRETEEEISREEENPEKETDEIAEESSKLEEKLKEANDKYVRLFAEFDNFRNRSEKEKSQRYDFGARDMVERILPVIDNFERGLAAVPEDKADDSFVTGMQMTYKQLMKALEDAGVKAIEAVGQEFDPEYHNAVMHVDDPEAGDNTIVEEFQKGYMYKDHVVRYSMVKVAN